MRSLQKMPLTKLFKSTASGFEFNCLVACFFHLRNSKRLKHYHNTVNMLYLPFIVNMGSIQNLCKTLFMFCLFFSFFSVTDAAYSLVQKKSQLFAFSSNNSLLQFVLEVSKLINLYLVYMCSLVNKSATYFLVYLFLIFNFVLLTHCCTVKVLKNEIL
jgi:hypothetical protein